MVQNFTIIIIFIIIIIIIIIVVVIIIINLTIFYCYFSGLLIQILHYLWDEEKREMQAFGCDLAQTHRALLLGDATEDHFKEAMTCIQHLITNKSWWDTVDALSYPGRLIHLFIKLYK